MIGRVGRKDVRSQPSKNQSFSFLSETEFALRRKRLGSVIPKEDDLHGSAQALIRLQDVYELSIRDLVNGGIGQGDKKLITNAGLSAQV